MSKVPLGPLSWPTNPNFVQGQQRWRQFKIGAATAGTNAQSIVDSYTEDVTGTSLTCSVGSGHQWTTGNFNGDRFYILLRDHNGNVLTNYDAYNVRVLIETVTEPANNSGLQVIMGFTANSSVRAIEGTTAPICGVSMKWDTSVSSKRRYRVGGKNQVQTSGAELGDHARATITIGADATESNWLKPLSVFGSGFFLGASNRASSRWEHVVKDPFGTDVIQSAGYVVVGIGATKALSSVTGKFKFWYSVDRMHKGWAP